MISTSETRQSFIGGAKRDRTADLLHAMQALYQLSYNPNRVLWEHSNEL